MIAFIFATKYIILILVYRCFVDLGRPYGRIINNIYTVTKLMCIAVNIICYGLVWGRIKQNNSQSKDSNKYQRSAKIMMLFVTAYIIQVLPLVIFFIWNMFSTPNVYFAVVVMIFYNMGGIFNFLVYILICKKYQQTGQ